jgi:hypothetical protein
VCEWDEEDVIEHKPFSFVSKLHRKMTVPIPEGVVGVPMLLSCGLWWLSSICIN